MSPTGVIYNWELPDILAEETAPFEAKIARQKARIEYLQSIAQQALSYQGSDHDKALIMRDALQKIRNFAPSED